MTVLEVIQKSAEFLGKKGVESPRLNTELLLAHVLQLPRMKLYLNFERVLAPAELDTVRALVKRRGTREPLQHIVGSANFCGLDFAVSPAVLVPRPETEMLAEKSWELLRTMAPPPVSPPGPGPEEGKELHESFPPASAAPAPVVLDFGTGSGCLAILMAVKHPTARILALDISPEALAVARANAARHQVEGRIEFLLGDGLEALPQGVCLDMVVSNPPYIPSAEIPTLEPEVRGFDPRLALDGGADGLAFYRRLAEQAPGRMRPGGHMLLEFGDGQAPAIQTIFAGRNWVIDQVMNDYTGRPRFLFAHLDQT